MTDQTIPPAVLKLAQALVANGIIDVTECAKNPRQKPYRVPEVAALLDVHRSTVYRDIESGRCGAYRVGEGSGALRISVEDFEAYKTLLKKRASTRPDEVREVTS